uniref:Uncharacterized protein n=1 Tax=Candidatus Kentrum sp. LPFa TaxID=2126335 RepID=A0A450W407_9GAMM|nr:MAG: hypothetical protein BECKLPF1236B_GA0070989_102420 [Candidatus Kentron sp. LPFa]
MTTILAIFKLVTFPEHPEQNDQKSENLKNVVFHRPFWFRIFRVGKYYVTLDPMGHLFTYWKNKNSEKLYLEMKGPFNLGAKR